MKFKKLTRLKFGAVATAAPSYNAFVCTEKYPANPIAFENQTTAQLKKSMGNNVNVKYAHGLGAKTTSAQECVHEIDRHFPNLNESATFQVNKHKIEGIGTVLSLSWRNRHSFLQK